MKTIKIVILISLLLFAKLNFGINLPRVIENTIYSENIKTVEMYRAGWKLSNPILTLNSDDQLVFSFDDLINETHDYYYTIYHCDRNWNQSKITQQDYLDSFIDFPITDFEYSVNTTVHYINYMLRIPNEDVPIVLSGNYALVVFDRNEPEVPVITWRFYVVEQRTRINARIRRATYDPVNGENQEIDFLIDHSNFAIQDPVSDVKVVVTQNNRSDNAIENLKPLFVNGNILEYEYNIENVFPGCNEFRFFDIRTIKYPGENIEEIKLYPPVYHATLFPDKLRTNKRYSFYKEMNGNFYVEALNAQYPDIEADYQFVHFTLPMDMPLLGGVYVFGKLSNWQCLQWNEMQWNIERNQYELTLLLKQGYYNYMYAFKNSNEKIVKCENLEGSHYETENDYQIYVYYGRITDKYDRLIGYNQFNSLSNRSF